MLSTMLSEGMVGPSLRGGARLGFSHKLVPGRQFSIDLEKPLVRMDCRNKSGNDGNLLFYINKIVIRGLVS
jgi:hypothetical protein